MNGDELRGLGARDPTPWGDRIEQGANDRRTSRDHAIGGGGLRARTVEPDETDPSTWRDRATGDDCSCGPTAQSILFRWALENLIWCLDIILGALQYIERRTRRETERKIQSPVVHGARV